MLINASTGFFNYRHSGNVYLFNEFFERMGFDKDQILIIQREDLLINERLHLDKFLFGRSRNETRYFEYKLVPIDDNYILNILELQCYEFKHLDENDNLFIYICGHGTGFYLKICNMYFLFRNDIMNKLRIISKRLNKIFVILDTCQAETLINRDDIPDNVFVLTTSSKFTKSYSIKSNSITGIAACDAFPFNFMKMPIKYDQTLIDFLEQLKDNKENYILTFCNKKNFIIKDFFSNKNENNKKIQVNKFVI